jgi:hypothetical protein
MSARAEAPDSAAPIGGSARPAVGEPRRMPRPGEGRGARMRLP